MWVDIHIESRLSEGKKNLVEMGEQALECALDGLVITDVGRLPALSDLEEAAEATGVLFFGGVKIPTDRGVWLAYPPDLSCELPELEPDEDGLFSIEVVASLGQEGWALVLSQPFLDGGPGEGVYDMVGFHGLEVSNGREPLSARDFALEAALALGQGVVGGSGSSGEPGPLGIVGTGFLIDLRDQRDFHYALVNRSVILVERGTRFFETDSDGDGGRSRRRPRKRNRKKKVGSD